MTNVSHLTCEYRTNPLGMDALQPRLSWQIESDQRGARQTAYQILVAPSESSVDSISGLLWDSGKIESDQSILVPYRGPVLASGQRVRWKVRIWDENGKDIESSSAWWEMGLLDRTDWEAQWIGAPFWGGPRTSSPAPYLRKEFTFQGEFVSARLYATAIGLYECYLNGVRIGDALFTPGWTDYSRRIQYQVYDVTDLIRSGTNAVGAILGDGWGVGHIAWLGLIAWGKNKSESRVTAEFYSLAIEVMRASEAISEYQGLPRQEAFDIEYWLLEEAKLKRMPPEKEFARHVVLVIGAGSGIGKATAHRMAKEGAQVVCVDLSQETAQATAEELIKTYGVGIGVAGTGLSGCGPAIGLGVDITDRASVQSMFEKVILAYGGIDNIIITAGIFVPPDKQGFIPDEKWALTYSINVTGPYLVADEARKIWQAQGLKSSLVITTSANAAVAKQGSLAYDTSKAAANHLVRELAIELAPLVRVNGLAPATVVEGSSMFPRERVVSSLAKYKIAFDESEGTEALRDKLANFYAQRTLTKSPITLADQAEVAYLLSSNKFSKTTGQIISVDGGLHEAFLR